QRQPDLGRGPHPVRARVAKAPPAEPGDAGALGAGGSVRGAQARARRGRSHAPRAHRATRPRVFSDGDADSTGSPGAPASTARGRAQGPARRPLAYVALNTVRWWGSGGCLATPGRTTPRTPSSELASEGSASNRGNRDKTPRRSSPSAVRDVV